MTKFYCLIAFTSRDIRQNVYYNCSLTSLWCHKFEITLFLLIKPFCYKTIKRKQLLFFSLQNVVSGCSGPVNNYVMLYHYVTLFWITHAHHHASSRMITRPPYVRSHLMQIPPFIMYVSFLMLKKKQRHALTHDSFHHVLKQLNQVVRFK